MTNIERIRKAIGLAVGSDRLTGITETDLLVEDGIISSLEIVVVGLELEREFQISIADSQMTLANFSSMKTLVMLIEQQQTGGKVAKNVSEEGTIYEALRISLDGCIRRPFVFIVLVCAWLLMLDRVVVPYVVERGPLGNMYSSFSDYGRRLYRNVGSWSPNDLMVAVQRHEFIKNSSNGAHPNILFFGDSGTVGSWGKAEDAPPAYAEAALKQTIPRAEVHNFAFFMPSFIKDSMLLEASMESSKVPIPVDAVVFTMSDAYFNMNFQKYLIKQIPYFSLNRDLLSRLRERIDSNEPNAYGEVLRYLAEVDRDSRGFFEEYILERTSVYRYQTFFKFLSLYGKDPDSYWKTEYVVGDTPLYAGMASPPATMVFQDGGFSKDAKCVDCVNLAENVIDFLISKKIKVFIVLRPTAPIEWKEDKLPAEFSTGPLTVDTVIRENGWDKKATIIDLRWALHANQFGDSISHYTPEGRRILGNAIGEKIAITMGGENPVKAVGAAP